MINNISIECFGEIIYIDNVLQENIHEIKIPDYITELHIDGDYLDHFDIPKGIISVHLDSIGLKTLNIPDGVETLFCSRNFLRTLEIPSSLYMLEAQNNLLTHFTFRNESSSFNESSYFNESSSFNESKSFNNLTHIDIRSNKFKSLNFDINDSIEYFNASFNEINYITPKIDKLLKNVFSIKLNLPENEDNLFYSKSI